MTDKITSQRLVPHHTGTSGSGVKSENNGCFVIKTEKVEWEVSLDNFVVVDNGDFTDEDVMGDGFSGSRVGAPRAFAESHDEGIDDAGNDDPECEDTSMGRLLDTHSHGDTNEKDGVVTDVIASPVLNGDLPLFDGVTAEEQSSQQNIPVVAYHEEVEAPACQSSTCCLASALASDGLDITMATTPIDMSSKERMRRERVRQRKVVQRQNAAFRERERLKAKERMKALRDDPVYRFHERQRDRERRKKARLNNQVQRAREREKDRVRKALTRSANSDRQRDKVHLESFQLLLGVSESEDGEEQDNELTVAWETS